MAKYSLDKIKSLPEEALNNFYDPDVNTMYASEVFPYLTQTQIDEVKDMTVGVYYRLLTPGAFLSALKDLLKDEKLYNDIAVKILGGDFLKIADYLETDIMALLVQHGGDPNLFRKDLPVSDVIVQVRRKFPMPLDDERLSKRLDKILETVVVDVRKDEQALPMLTGNPKTSGVGLDDATAKALLKLVHDELGVLKTRGIQVLTDEDYERKYRVQEALEPGPQAEDIAEEVIEEEPAAPEPPTSPEPKKESAVTVQPEDVREIARIEKTTENKVDVQTAKTVDSILQGLVDEAVAISGLKLDNEDMVRRFKTMLSLYFRDLRDAMETKSKLTMPVMSGGMGMEEAKAEQLMSLMAVKASEYRSATNAKAEQEKQQYVQAQTEKTLGAAEREARQEKDVLDARFATMVQKTGVAPAPAVAAPPTPAAEKAGEPARLAPQMPSGAPVPQQPAPGPVRVIPVVSLDKKPVPPPPAPPNLPVAPMPELQAAKPASPAPVASAAPLPSEPAKAVVSDVAYTPKLTGPVEELRALKIKDFRRLSKDPAEATLKIKDKIDLLEDQGFELKTQGIKAWQDSEPNRLYLDMLRKSLEGKPVTDVINEMEAKGEIVLTKAEFDAVMALNRQLRFG